MSNQSDITKGYCNNCLGERDHHLISEYAEEWKDVLDEHEGVEISIRGSVSFEILKCCGCDHATVRHRLWCSEWEESEVRYYPPAMSRKIPGWIQGGSWPEGFVFWHDHFVPTMLQQVYVALFNSCPALAAMGIRALLERVMIDKVGDQGGFGKNLDAFEAAGYLSKSSREALNDVLELGHATIHRNFSPSQSDVLRALDIAEGVLASVYWHEKQAAEIKKRVPPRPPRK